MSFIEQLHPWSFTASDGITLRGWQTTLRNKPIIYFRHGNGFNCLTYQPMLEVLAEQFDLIMMDAQGHGDSDRGESISWQGCARHALEHIEHCYPQWNAGSVNKKIPLYGLGHSFGGILTLLVAGRQPLLFDRVVLLDPVLFPRAYRSLNALLDWLGLNHRNPMVSQALRRRYLWPSRRAAYQYLHDRGAYKGWDDRALWAYVNHALAEDEHGVCLKCEPETEAAIFAGQTGPLWPSIKRVSKPMTIITGQDSYPFVQRSAIKASKHNAAIQALSITGGHCFMQQHPQHTARLIIERFTQDS